MYSSWCKERSVSRQLPSSPLLLLWSEPGARGTDSAHDLVSWAQEAVGPHHLVGLMLGTATRSPTTMKGGSRHQVITSETSLNARLHERKAPSPRLLSHGISGPAPCSPGHSLSVMRYRSPTSSSRCGSSALGHTAGRGHTRSGI